MLNGDSNRTIKEVTQPWRDVEFGEILERVKDGIIIQQVNAQGYMGSGIAKAIRDKWPFVWESYSAMIHQNTHDQGRSYMGMVIYTQVKDGLYVANLVGQQYFGRNKIRYTSYDAIDVGMAKIASFAQDNDVQRIHYPTIGCGLGGGNWSIVKAIIDYHLGDKIPHTLWYQPGEAPK